MATAAAAEEEEGEGGSGRATEVEVPCYGVSVILHEKEKGSIFVYPLIMIMNIEYLGQYAMAQSF